MLQYLYFGRQCPGPALEVGAKAAAELLGRPFESIDVSVNPKYAKTYRMFFPGLIVAGELRLAYPGSAQHLAESIRIKAPLPGKQEYQQLPEAEPDRVELLSKGNIQDIRGICIPTHLACWWSEKEQWLKSFALPCMGLVGFKEGVPVAVAEILPRKLVPYPVPEYRGLFITCLYGRHNSEVDYRRGLLRVGLPLLKELGYTRVGIVAGRSTPYPNGPVKLLARAGFCETEDLGRVILCHRWEDQVFMQREL